MTMTETCGFEDVGAEGSRENCLGFSFNVQGSGMGAPCQGSRSQKKGFVFMVQ